MVVFGLGIGRNIVVFEACLSDGVVRLSRYGITAYKSFRLTDGRTSGRIAS